MFVIRRINGEFSRDQNWFEPPVVFTTDRFKMVTLRQWFHMWRLLRHYLLFHLFSWRPGKAVLRDCV